MPRVDYERSAATYRKARTLPPEILDAWAAAIEPLRPPDCRAVLDVGAGTGQFLQPLARWFDAPVIALEPSPAMRTQAAAGRPGGSSGYVAGVAEHLPFAARSFDVAWLSTVLHQFDDRARAARELRRVLRPGGRVLVRGFFADLTVTGFLARFPGIERAAATFPSTDATRELFAAAGFRADRVIDVGESWTFQIGPWVERVRSMRHVDSALRPLTDAEIEQGIADVQAEHPDPSTSILSPTTLRLVVLRS